MKMIQTIARILKTDDQFLVASHVNPDGDAIGSLLGLYLALTEMKKRAWPMCADRLSHIYDFLPGRDALIANPETIRPAPNWIIAVDTAEENRISGDVAHVRGQAKLINIDHHRTNPNFGDVNLVEPTATSSAEIVFRVLSEMGYTLSPEVGKCLYTGLITDTGCFRFSGVDSRTLEVGAQLLASGFDSYEVTRHLFEEQPFSRLQLERLMLERIEILLGGILSLSIFYTDDFGRVGADKTETESLVDRLREIRGVEVGVLITQMSEGVTRVSLRSKGRLDVASIAVELGGGGHPEAAGLKTHLPPHEIKQRVTQAVEDALALPSNPTEKINPR
jgi:phosphoesterase RecJ-like protein